MNSLSSVIDERNGQLVGAVLMNTDLDQGRAASFLGAARNALLRSAANRLEGLDLSKPGSAANVDWLISGVDVLGLALRGGVTRIQALHGLDAVVPLVLGFLGSTCNGPAPESAHQSSRSARFRGCGRLFA